MNMKNADVGVNLLTIWMGSQDDGARCADARVGFPSLSLSSDLPTRFDSIIPRRNLLSTYVTPWSNPSGAHAVYSDFHLR